MYWTYPIYVFLPINNVPCIEPLWYSSLSFLWPIMSMSCRKIQLLYSILNIRHECYIFSLMMTEPFNAYSSTNSKKIIMSVKSLLFDFQRMSVHWSCSTFSFDSLPLIVAHPMLNNFLFPCSLISLFYIPIIVSLLPLYF